MDARPHLEQSSGSSGFGDYLKALGGLDGFSASPLANKNKNVAVFCDRDRVTQCADELADALPRIIALTGDGGVPTWADVEVVRQSITVMNGLGESDGAVAMCNLLQLLAQRAADGGRRLSSGGLLSAADNAEAVQRARQDAEIMREERDRMREELEESRKTARTGKEKLRLQRAEHEQALKAMQRERDIERRKVQGFSKKEEQFQHEIRRHQQEYQKLQLRVKDIQSGKEAPPSRALRKGTGAFGTSVPRGVPQAEVAAMTKKHEAEMNDLLLENDELRECLEEVQGELEEVLASREELLDQLAELGATAPAPKITMQPSDAQTDISADDVTDTSQDETTQALLGGRGTGGALRLYKPAAGNASTKSPIRKQWGPHSPSGSEHSFAVHDENVSNEA